MATHEYCCDECRKWRISNFVPHREGEHMSNDTVHAIREETLRLRIASLTRELDAHRETLRNTSRAYGDIEVVIEGDDMSNDTVHAIREETLRLRIASLTRDLDLALHDEATAIEQRDEAREALRLAEAVTDAAAVLVDRCKPAIDESSHYDEDTVDGHVQTDLAWRDVRKLRDALAAWRRAKP